jgi:hypothetical protein
MDGLKYWVVNGRIDPDPFADPEVDSPETLMQRKGGVFVSSGRDGTTIRWALFAGNWASIYYVAETISNLPGPYNLEFFLAGWFTQTVRNPREASDRLQDLLVKSDIHLRQKTFVKAIPTDTTLPVPDALGAAIMDRHFPADRSVECVFDDTSGRFFVERLGRNSTIAKMWGTSPTTFPCQTGHSYDQMISQAYSTVMKTGEIHYDHVLASMVTSAQKQVWIPYQRVVLPHQFPDGRRGVAVMSEVADVDIKPV